MEALILAGGQGTRLRPLTHLTPKPLVPFMGEPFAHGLLRRLVEVGVTRATFLVGQTAEPFGPLLAAAPRLGLEIAVAPEETPLDTAGAVRRHAAALPQGEPLLVCNGDVLSDVDLAALLQAHKDAEATATLHLVRVEDTAPYGVVACDTGGRVLRFVEKPPPGTETADTISAGTYVLQPEAFLHFPGDGPLSFERSVFPGLLERAEVLHGVATDHYWQDLGTPGRYLDGHRAVLDGRCRWPLGEGMELREGPSAVHASAQAGESGKVGAYSVIGEGCRIAAGAEVTGSVLHERVVIGAGSTVTDTLIGFEAFVGEGVTVPPGSVLGPRCRLGA